MAEVIGTVASVVSLASTTITLLQQIRKARDSIKGVSKTLDDISKQLGDLERSLSLVKDEEGLRTAGIEEQINAIHEAAGEVKTFLEKLATSQQKKALKQYIQALTSGDQEDERLKSLLNRLDRARDGLALRIQIAQAGVLSNLKNGFQNHICDLLPTTGDAAFDSHAQEHNKGCHPQTRVELLQQIREWSDDPSSKHMYWLNGIYGTGKSTIARTLAQSFKDQGVLSASFFFKRGERDRGNAGLFFTTIAAQLVARHHILESHIRAAINAEPDLPKKALREQFEKLILQPLSKVYNDQNNLIKMVVVVDALDECNPSADSRIIIDLLSKINTLSSVRMKIIITSRPELPLCLGFDTIKGTFQDIALHQIPEPVIRRDIYAFLKSEFARIMIDYNRSGVPEKLQLPSLWPGEGAIDTLVRMAVPLFIFAATVIRFVEDSSWGDPAGQLDKVLDYQNNPSSSELDQLQATYLPILDQLIVGKTGPKRSRLVSEFRDIVGSIVLLAEPLSMSSLAILLNIPGSNPERVIFGKLSSLHSVLSIPPTMDAPVRMFHLSFRDFLIDPEHRATNEFWIGERETHGKLAVRCLQLLSESRCLKKDICTLGNPGISKEMVNKQTIAACLQPQLQYACVYWVHHLKESGGRLQDNDQIYQFLKTHFLYWLEALNLLGKISEAIGFIEDLQNIAQPEKGSDLLGFLHDAKRFTSYNRSLIERAPLQLYYSALLYAPENSIIKRQFAKDISPWVCMKSRVQADWSAAIQTLEGHLQGIFSVAFNGKVLASASADHTVRLWDSNTGTLLQVLEGHSALVTSVAFSPDGTKLATGCDDCLVRLWDAGTGTLLHTLEGHGPHFVRSVAFSFDGKILVSGGNDWSMNVRLWNVCTGTLIRTLDGHTNCVISVAFSRDGKVASGSDDYTTRLWDSSTGAHLRMLEGDIHVSMSLAFSADGMILASGSTDHTVRLWDANNGYLLQSLNGHSSWVSSVAFSPNGKIVASSSVDDTVMLWDAWKEGSLLQTFKCHSQGVRSVAFSGDGNVLVSGSQDGTIQLWDTSSTIPPPQNPESHSETVTVVAFSPSGELLASGSADQTIQLWDVGSAAPLRTLRGHSGTVGSVAFSPCSKVVASASDDRTVRLWDTVKGVLLQTFKVNKTATLSFSTSGQYLKTDYGILDMSPFHLSPGPAEQLRALVVIDGWVVEDGEKLLCFSRDYQVTAVAVWGEIIALGYSSGYVSFIQFVKRDKNDMV